MTDNTNVPQTLEDTRLDQILQRLESIEKRLTEYPNKQEVSTMITAVIDERAKAYLTAVETQARIDAAVDNMRDKITDMFRHEAGKLTDTLRIQANGMIDSFSVNTRKIQESFDTSMSKVQAQVAQSETRMEAIRELHLQSLTSTSDLLARLSEYTERVHARIDVLSDTIKEDALKPITDLTTFKAQLEVERIRRDAQWSLVKTAWGVLRENKWLIVPLAIAGLLLLQTLYPDIAQEIVSRLGGG